MDNESLSPDDIYNLASKINEWNFFRGTTEYYGYIWNLQVKMSYFLSGDQGPTEINVVVSNRIGEGTATLGRVSARDEKFISLYERVRKEYDNTVIKEKEQAKVAGLGEAKRILKNIR